MGEYVTIFTKTSNDPKKFKQEDMIDVTKENIVYIDIDGELCKAKITSKESIDGARWFVKDSTYFVNTEDSSYKLLKKMEKLTIEPNVSSISIENQLSLYTDLFETKGSPSLAPIKIEEEPPLLQGKRKSSSSTPTFTPKEKNIVDDFSLEDDVESMSKKFKKLNDKHYNSSLDYEEPYRSFIHKLWYMF